MTRSGQKNCTAGADLLPGRWMPGGTCAGFLKREEEMPVTREVQGLVVRLLGGFYSVRVLEEGGYREYETRARGLFRNQDIRPCVGDWATVRLEEDGSGTLTRIAPRKNSFVRPPLANLDQLVLVAAAAQPQPNLLVLDKMTAICQHKGVDCFVAVTKSDLGDSAPLEQIYRRAGFRTAVVCAPAGEGVENLRRELAGKVSAFCGNSGVGKSSLLNAIDPRLSLDTADISQKLGRGRHTTRHVELYPLEGGGYIADTPGFSSVDLEKYEVILKDELQYCFREFEPFIPQCRFTGCSHTKEKGCAVLEAVRSGLIPRERHESYLALYEEAKQLREWELRE